MRNLNLLFYKEYYEKLGTENFASDVSEKNNELINARFDKKLKPPVENCQFFVLKVLYPGLLIGTGLPHGAGKLGGSDDDVNMGFSFDYVTGQPYIPGSSVKGILRSHFKNHAIAVAEILNKNGYADIDEDVVNKLEESIFDNSDIFFDAVVCSGNSEGKLIDFDYITPHVSPTKNPTPVYIIKVLPDVQFEFRFKISDKKIDDIKFTAGKIKWLFQELLLLFGAGAKTNVGYGVFEKVVVSRPKAAKGNKGGKKKQQNKPQFQDDNLSDYQRVLQSLLKKGV